MGTERNEAITMTSVRRSSIFVLCLWAFLLLAVHVASAANGMNMIGFGAESVAMGGADLAVTDSPSSMNINHSPHALDKARLRACAMFWRGSMQ